MSRHPPSYDTCMVRSNSSLFSQRVRFMLRSTGCVRPSTSVARETTVSSPAPSPSVSYVKNVQVWGSSGRSMVAVRQVPSSTLTSTLSNGVGASEVLLVLTAPNFLRSRVGTPEIDFSRIGPQPGFSEERQERSAGPGGVAHHTMDEPPGIARAFEHRGGLDSRPCLELVERQGDRSIDEARDPEAVSGSVHLGIPVMADYEEVFRGRHPRRELSQVLRDPPRPSKPRKVLRHIREWHHGEFLGEPRRGPPGHRGYGKSDGHQPCLAQHVTPSELEIQGAGGLVSLHKTSPITGSDQSLPVQSNTRSVTRQGLPTMVRVLCRNKGSRRV